MASPVRVVLLGPPGSGKGTIAVWLESKYGSRHLSSGQWLRGQVAAGTPLGQRVENLLRQGQFAPDDLMIEILPTLLEAGGWSKGTLLDGFPRNLRQAVALDELTGRMGAPVDAALLIKVPHAELIQRMAGRRTCTKCGAVYQVQSRPPTVAGICDRCGEALMQREDDRSEVIAERLKIFALETEPLAAYYRGQGKLVELDAAGTGEEVGLRAAAVLGL